GYPRTRRRRQQCWARRDNDQHLDRRLSSTCLCPTYTCPGQPLVSTEVIIREPCLAL
ncbi:MAG: hypothetical protein, partial [Olavius algarvensis Gamma 1 endosymbiont]